MGSHLYFWVPLGIPEPQESDLLVGLQECAYGSVLKVLPGSLDISYPTEL